MTREEYGRWKKEGGLPEDYSFTLKYSSSGSLATRDIVARATDEELKKSGDDSVFLVSEHLGDDIVNRFPTIQSRLQRHGLSLTKNPLPVSPAAHYFVGGLSVDENGGVLQDGLERVIGGLYAIGEVACTGMHGANRLASNSLLEAVVFAHRASEHLITDIQGAEPRELPNWRADEMVEMREHAPLVHDRSALQSTMTDDVGLVKSNIRLQRAERRLNLLNEEVERLWQRCKPSKELVQLRNMVQVARSVCSASIARKFNIGLHYNKDLT